MSSVSIPSNGSASSSGSGSGFGSGSGSGFLISDNDGTSISVDSKTFSRKVCLLNFTISSYSCPTPT